MKRELVLIRLAHTCQDLTNQWSANGLSVKQQGLAQVRVAEGERPQFLSEIGQTWLQPMGEIMEHDEDQSWDWVCNEQENILRSW